MNRNPRRNDEHPDEHPGERPQAPRNERPAPRRDIDQEIRINELTEKAKELGISSLHTADDCPPDIEEAFLSNIVAYESAPLVRAFDTLEANGVLLPAPESLDDAAIHAKLWEVIRALAEEETYLSHTDHLSDRELYTSLWTDLLREENPSLPKGMGWNSHIDVIGSGSEKDIEIGLRYYDTEEDRQHWATKFPDMVIPPHEPLPHDRDRLLPKPLEPMDELGEGEEDDESSEFGFDSDFGLDEEGDGFGETSR